jgi:hypothetical protein
MEYVRLLEILNKAAWPELLEKLQGPNAATFVGSMQEYLDAWERAQNEELSYYQDKFNQTPAENAEHRERIRQAQWRQVTCHMDLSLLIYGHIDHADLRRYIKDHPYEEDE